MRDRLIELIQDSVGGCARYWAETISDHLLSEGVIVPPCKVGDIVYTAHWHWGTYIEGDIMPYQITNITITQNKKGVRNDLRLGLFVSHFGLSPY
jgi:hypothetical protein